MVKEKKYKCDQKKCVYLQLGTGCRKCEDCGIEPYILDDNCPRCWNCSKDEGILRWDDKGGKGEITVQIENEITR